MSYKCSTCFISFQNSEEVRAHYDTEWHLANVRLRVEGKKPITQTEFRRANAIDDPEDGKPKFACKLCKKTYHSIQTLQSHVKSTEHLMKKEVRILSRDSEAASMLTSTSLGSAAIGLHRRNRMHHKPQHLDPEELKAKELRKKALAKMTEEDRDVDASATHCLFCSYPSATLKDNLKHMYKAHQFMIPLAHRCTDVPGLVEYLARKVNGALCLVCGTDGRGFSTLEAVRNHMQHENHERIVLTPEYDEFYKGGLDDPTEAPPERAAPTSNQLVVREGKATGRRDTRGLIHQRHETAEQMLQRRAITNANADAQAVLRKERQTMMRDQQKKENKVLRHYQSIHNKMMMQRSIRANKLHPKGYDGEGEVN